MASNMKPFWMVWNRDGNAPRVAHDTPRKATMEAERLARANPGCEFYVLETVSYRCVNDMVRVEFDNRDVPF